MSRLLCVLVLTYVCLFGSASLVSGLKCYSCSYIATFSSDATALQLFAQYSENEPKCAVGDDSRQLQPIVCPTSTNDMVVMCSKFEGSGMARFGTANFSSSYYNRGCVEMPRGSAQACATSSDREKSGLNRLLAGLRIDVQNFAGQFCVCATDNCNGQGKLLSEKLVWIAGLVLAVLGSQRW